MCARIVASHALVRHSAQSAEWAGLYRAGRFAAGGEAPSLVPKRDPLRGSLARATPDKSATISSAWRKSEPVTSLTNSNTSPPAPQPKHFQTCFSGLTKNEGCRSEWSGHRPTSWRPDRRSRVNRPAIAARSTRAFKSRALCGAGSFIGTRLLRNIPPLAFPRWWCGRLNIAGIHGRQRL